MIMMRLVCALKLGYIPIVKFDLSHGNYPDVPSVILLCGPDLVSGVTTRRTCLV